MEDSWLEAAYEERYEIDNDFPSEEELDRMYDYFEDEDLED